MRGSQVARNHLPWLSLGLRLTVGGGWRSAVRAVLLGLAAAAGIVLVLGAMAVPSVVDAQARREAARQPVTADPAEPTALRIVTVPDAVAGRPLLRVNVSGAGDASPVPPGVGALPSDGEMLVSPALRDLMAENAYARSRFSQTVIGIIDTPGLIAPDELIAYVGIPVEQMPTGTPTIRAFGGVVRTELAAPAQGSRPLEGLLTPGRLAAFAFAFFLLVPLAVLLSTCARLSATARDQRFAALRLLGASTRQAQVTNAAEMGFVALVGVAVGYLAFPMLARFSGAWSAGRFHWFAADVTVRPVSGVIACIGIVAFAVVIGAVSAAPAISRPLRMRRDGVAGRPASWRLTTFAAAVAVLGSTGLAASLSPAVGLVLFGVGAVGVAVMLPLVLPSTVYSLVTPILRWSASPVWARLMARRVRHRPAMVPRLVAAVAAAVFIGGVAMIAAVSYGREQEPDRIADQDWLPQALAGDAELAGRLADEVGAQNVAYYEYLGATIAERPDQPVAVIRGTCADLAILFDGTGTCRDGAAYRVQGSGDGLPVGSALMPADAVYDAVAAYRVPAQAIELGTSPFGQYADLVIAERPRTGSIAARVGATRDALERWYAAIAAHAPATIAQGYREVPRGFDAGAVIVLLGAGLVLSVSMGLVSFSIAAADRALAGRRLNVPLAILGTPRRVVRAAEAGQSLIAVVAGLALALALVVLAAWAWSAVFDMPAGMLVATVNPMVALVVAGVAVGAITTIVATTSSGRPTAELLRHE